MKNQLSSFDIAALVREFQQCLDLRVEKIFFKGYDELFIRLTGIGIKKTISIKLGQAMWLDHKFRTSDSVEPPTFAMLLRKYMSGKAIISITQHGFDRIVIFELQDDIKLIAELFGGGNIILVEKGKIIQPLTSKSWKAREVKKGYDYVFPPESTNPFALSQDELTKIITESKKDLVRCLAMDVNLGGAYSEEICHSLARDKKDKAAELSEDEIAETFEIIQTFNDMLANPQPQIILDDEDLVDVLPFELSMYANLDKREFETHSLAVKEYFANLPENIVEEGPQKSQRQLQLERQLAHQLEAMEKQALEANQFQIIGDNIYANYGLLDGLLNKINKILEAGNWQAAKSSIIEFDSVSDFNPAEGILTAIFQDGTEVQLDVRLSLNDNASKFYDKSKKSKHKLEGAGIAVEETRKLLDGAVKEVAKKFESGNKKPTKRFWFDKFRWFQSSQGHMVVAGRDARTNDHVVKKHLKDGDFYAHADMSGAPSVVIKEVSKDDEQTLHEACIFAVAFSKAWKGKIASGSAYWVKPDQVSKTPQPGEFLARGAFVIRGKRNYSKKLDMRLAIGKVLVQGTEKIMCGPESALAALTTEYYIIEPGDEKRTLFSRKLSDKYNVPIEEIDRVLPPGDIRLIK